MSLFDNQSKPQERSRAALALTKDLAILGFSAGQYALNLRWQTESKRKVVRFLDFDLICASLEPLGITRWINETQILKREPSDVNLMGPWTLRMLLSDSDDDYSIPPGAEFELLAWKEKLGFRLSESAKKVKRIFSEAPKSPNPVRSILEGIPGRKLSEVVREELEGITVISEAMDVLEQVQEKSVPADELITSIPTTSYKAYETARDLVSEGRERLTLNASNDAVNVAIVVCVFTQPKPPKGSALMPLMFSQTKQVTGLLDSQQALLLPKKQELAVFNSPHYLIVDRILRSDSGSSNRRCSIRADQLSVDARLISKQCEEFLDARFHSQKTSEDLLWEELCNAIRDFEQEWGPYLEPSRVSAELDNVTMRNTLFSPETAHLLARLDEKEPRRIRAGIAQLVNHLDEQVARNGRLSLLLRQPESSPIESGIEPIESLFRFELLEHKQNDGRPIRDCDASEPLMVMDLKVIAGKHDFRATVRHKIVSSETPFMAVDSWFEPSQSDIRWVGVMWQHQSDYNVLWREGVRLLDSMRIKMPIATDATCMMFGSGGEREQRIHLPNGLKQVSSQPTDLWRCDSFELRDGSLLYLSDLRPLEGREFQAGIILPATCWSRFAIDTLIAAMLATRNMPMSKEHYSAIIKFLFKRLHVHINLMDHYEI